MAMTQNQLGVLARAGVDKIIYGAEDAAEKMYTQFMGPTFNDNQSYWQVAHTTEFGMMGVVDEDRGIPYDTWRVARTKTYSHVMRALGFQFTEQSKASDYYNQVKMPLPKLLEAADATREQVAANVLNLGFSTAAANLGADGKPLFSTTHVQEIGAGSNTSATLAFSIGALRTAVTAIKNQKSEKGRPFPVPGPYKLVVPVELSILAEETIRSTKMPTTPNNEPNVAGQNIGSLVTLYYASSATAWFLLSENKKKNPLFFLQRINRKSGVEWDMDHLINKVAVWEEFIASFLTWRGTWGTEGA